MPMLSLSPHPSAFIVIVVTVTCVAVKCCAVSGPSPHTTNFQLFSTLRMSGALPPALHNPSWHGALLKAGR
jgi:hypothetical protein